MGFCAGALGIGAGNADRSGALGGNADGGVQQGKFLKVLVTKLQLVVFSPGDFAAEEGEAVGGCGGKIRRSELRAGLSDDVTLAVFSLLGDGSGVPAASPAERPSARGGDGCSANAGKCPVDPA